MSVNKQLLDAAKEMLVDVRISQNNMRHAAGRDAMWEGCAEAIQPRVDALQRAIAAAEQAQQAEPVAVALPVVLTEPERKFLEFVYRNPGCKCGCAWGNEGPLWPRLEELGLIRATGSYKWECTPAVSLSIATQPPAVAGAVPEGWIASVHAACIALEAAFAHAPAGTGDASCRANLTPALSALRDTYRAMLAAAPQGASCLPAEMTPAMMRAVQMRSELGAYAAANLSGAYDLFADFWRVAVEEVKKGGAA